MIPQINESEQNARFLIQSIRKAITKGDLKAAGRRIAGVRDLTTDREISKSTLGELLLLAASVARACGKQSAATEFVMEILHGKGGMSIETLGRAKRLRARLLLDENKLDEAEVLVGTADRYILTGLMEEKIERSSAGREVKVSTPVDQKILDKGEFISFETYFLLAEIAVLAGDWEKALWNLNRAFEKHRDGRLFPELEMWRGIVQMAKGHSFIECIDPVIAQGNVPAVLIGRIEALLNESRRADCALNEAEFIRFQRIGELARQRPLHGSKVENVEEGNESPIAVLENELLSSGSSGGNLNQANLAKGSISVNLIDWSLLSLVELCNMERLTGSIEIRWNETAVATGIEEGILDPAVLSGSGSIYCQNGRFIDAELKAEGPDRINVPEDPKQRSAFNLHQVLMTSIGGGCWKILDELQAGQSTFAQNSSAMPQIFGSIRRDSEVGERKDWLQITSNVNTCLDVAKILDEIRGNISNEEDSEINWDAEWGTAPVATAKKTVETARTLPDNSPIITAAGAAAPAFLPADSSNGQTGDIRDLSDFTINENSLFDFGDQSHKYLESGETDSLDGEIDKTFASLEAVKGGAYSDSPTNQLPDIKIETVAAPGTDTFQEIAPPWGSNQPATGPAEIKGPGPEKRETPRPVPELALIGEEIDELVKAESWFKVNENLARILSAKFNCGVRSSISREDEDFIAASAGDGVEKIARTTATVFHLDFEIIEKIRWVLKTDRQLEIKETNFSRNLFEIGKLTLLNLDHIDGQEVRSIGGVAIADDEWLRQYMMPPVSLVMRKKINEAQVYASQDGVTHPKAHILLGGETGTGKDVFARVIHAMSGRRNKDFVRADMGAIGGGDQFIATMFGAVRGAYTGQTGDRRGLVEEAEGGTLFLNEIGNLSLESQRALLDFMQEGCYTRMGDTKLRNADVRVILATNENINDAARFRQDVKFRCAPPIILPPLRDRREDIASLATSFGGTDIVLREAALKLLEFQTWPGNVRELSQVVKSAVARIGGSGEIRASVIEEVLASLSGGQDTGSLNFPVPPSGILYSDALQAYEKFLVEYSLNLTGNKKSQAAALWGESPASMTKKVKKWNLDDNE